MKYLLDILTYYKHEQYCFKCFVYEKVYGTHVYDNYSHLTVTYQGAFVYIL